VGRRPVREDPIVFKKLIYEMRFDEVSAVYALFGSFYLGVRLPIENSATGSAASSRNSQRRRQSQLRGKEVLPYN